MADDLARLLAEDEALQAQGFLAQPAAEALQGAMEEAEATAPTSPASPLAPTCWNASWARAAWAPSGWPCRADGRFEGQVAVKFLKTALFGAGARFGTLGGDHAGSRFAREGQILARLSHPHIARLLDAGVFEGQQPYLVLEYVDGLPIDRLLRAASARRRCPRQALPSTCSRPWPRAFAPDPAPRPQAQQHPRQCAR